MDEQKEKQEGKRMFTFSPVMGIGAALGDNKFFSQSAPCSPKSFGSLHQKEGEYKRGTYVHTYGNSFRWAHMENVYVYIGVYNFHSSYFLMPYFI